MNHQSIIEGSSIEEDPILDSSYASIIEIYWFSFWSLGNWNVRWENALWQLFHRKWYENSTESGTSRFEQDSTPDSL